MNDKSGNGHTLTTSGSGRPTSGVVSFNGLNALSSFAANGLVSAHFTQAQPISVFAIGKLTTTAGIQQINGNSVSSPTLLTNGGKWQIYAGSVVGANSCDTALHCFSQIFNGASSALYVDGASNASGNPGSTGFTGGNSIIIGCDGSASVWGGSIGEIIYYASALNTTDRQAVEAYLKAKWGTP